MRFTITLKIIVCTSLLLLLGVAMGIFAAIASSDSERTSVDIRDTYVAVSTVSTQFNNRMLVLRALMQMYMLKPSEAAHKDIVAEMERGNAVLDKAVALAEQPRVKELMPEVAQGIMEVDALTDEYMSIAKRHIDTMLEDSKHNAAFLAAGAVLEENVEKMRVNIRNALNRAIRNGGDTALTLSGNYEKASNMYRDALLARDFYSRGVALFDATWINRSLEQLAGTEKILKELLESLFIEENIALADKITEALAGMKTHAQWTYQAYSNMAAENVKRGELNRSMIAKNNEIGTMVDTQLTQAATGAAASLGTASVTSIVFAIVVLVAGVLIMLFLYFSVTKPLGAFVGMVGSLTSGDGDLTKRLPANGRDELSDLAVAFNRFIENVQEIVVEVKRSADELASANNQLASTMEELSTTFGSQTEEVTSIVTDMEQVRDDSRNSVADLNTCLTIMNEASDETDKGTKKLADVRDSISAIHAKAESLSETISRLSDSSAQIGDILNVINDIADQTNLLSLNAAIEAARAGEAGRGFAVVADEVKKLAERTQKATSEIETIISSLLKESEMASNEMSETAVAVNSGVEIIDETAKSFEQVISGIYNVRENTTAIVGTVTGQFDTIQAVGDKTQVVASGVEESNAAVSEVTITVSHLQEMTEKLKAMVERFKS